MASKKNGSFCTSATKTFCRIRVILGKTIGLNQRSAATFCLGGALRRWRLAVAALLIAALAALPAGAAASGEIVRLATTTSTENSGLLGSLLPEFTRDTGFTVHVVAVGTGKALRMGQDGDADVVLVHARPAEDRFMASGFGVDRRDVMYNDFVLVGPMSDPAGVKQAGDVSDALRRIAASGGIFVSRGDDSGTHKRERLLWERAGVMPGVSRYREAGQGMGKVLQIASELDAYTLTDRGTWLAYRGKLHLSLLFEGDPPLHNPYGIIVVNPKRYPDMNIDGAMRLVDWITAPKAQRMINEFRINGERLFIPLAIDVADL